MSLYQQICLQKAITFLEDAAFVKVLSQLEPLIVFEVVEFLWAEGHFEVKLWFFLDGDDGLILHDSSVILVFFWLGL